MKASLGLILFLLTFTGYSQDFSAGDWKVGALYEQNSDYRWAGLNVTMDTGDMIEHVELYALIDLAQRLKENNIDRDHNTKIGFEVGAGFKVLQKEGEHYCCDTPTKISAGVSVKYDQEFLSDTSDQSGFKPGIWLQARVKKNTIVLHLRNDKLNGLYGLSFKRSLFAE